MLPQYFNTWLENDVRIIEESDSYNFNIDIRVHKLINSWQRCVITGKYGTSSSRNNCDIDM